MKLDLGDEQAIRFAAKSAIRARLKSIRSSLPSEAINARSKHISERCASLVVDISGSRGGAVASYLPIAGEVDMHTFHDGIWKSGVQLALPVIDKTDANRLLWRDYRQDTPLEKSPLGFSAPGSGSWIETKNISAVIVPCLAADERGHRIGWGKGFYDRALAELEHATSIVVAYQFQMLAELPNTDGDRPATMVVTDTQIYEAANA